MFQPYSVPLGTQGSPSGPKGTDQNVPNAPCGPHGWPSGAQEAPKGTESDKNDPTGATITAQNVRQMLHKC